MSKFAQIWKVTFTYQIDLAKIPVNEDDGNDSDVVLFPSDSISDWPAAYGFRFGIRARRRGRQTEIGSSQDPSNECSWQFALAAYPDVTKFGRFALLCDYDLCVGSLHQCANGNLKGCGVAMDVRCNPRCSSMEFPDLNIPNNRLFVESDLMAHYTAHGREIKIGNDPINTDVFQSDFEDDCDAYWLSVKELQCDASAKPAIRVRLRCAKVLAESPQSTSDDADSKLPYQAAAENANPCIYTKPLNADLELLLPGVDRPLCASAARLSMLQCDTFDTWFKELRVDSIKRRVLHDWDKAEFYTFNECVLRYGDVIVPCRHLDTLLTLGTRLHLGKLLRACERLLTTSLGMHPIRKLEFAAAHGLALLADGVVRKMDHGRTNGRLLAVEEYLLATGQTVSDMHPDVLDLLQKNIVDNCDVDD